VEFREYNADSDKDAVHRIWLETGWLEKDSKAQAERMDLFLSAGRALVADLDGEPECLVLTMPGVIRHLKDDLPMSGVTGVTTSRIARNDCSYSGRRAKRSTFASGS